MTLDLDATDSMGRTALFWAARRGDASTTKHLLRAGSNPNLADSIGDSPLACSTSFACAKLLVSAGADAKVTNKYGQTPLFNAYRCIPVREHAKALIAAGAPLDARSCNGATALHFAADPGCVPMLQVLLDHGAEINALDDNSQNPLNYAQSDHLDTEDAIQFLIRSGADYTRPNKFGWTILHHAARFGTLRLVEILRALTLEKMDVGAVNQEGETALQVARRRAPKPNGFLEAFQLLLFEIRTRTAKGNASTIDDVDDAHAADVFVDALEY